LAAKAAAGLALHPCHLHKDTESTMMGSGNELAASLILHDYMKVVKSRSSRQGY
jgi:hypothetical protein